MSAMLQVRTSLDQAGWVAGLAGELETTEAAVVRTALELCQRDRTFKRRLRAELLERAAEAQREARELEVLEAQL